MIPEAIFPKFLQALKEVHFNSKTANALKQLVDFEELDDPEAYQDFATFQKTTGYFFEFLCGAKAIANEKTEEPILNEWFEGIIRTIDKEGENWNMETRCDFMKGVRYLRVMDILVYSTK